MDHYTLLFNISKTSINVAIVSETCKRPKTEVQKSFSPKTDSTPNDRVKGSKTEVQESCKEDGGPTNTLISQMEGLRSDIIKSCSQHTKFSYEEAKKSKN